MLRDSEMLVAAAQKLKDYEIKSTPQRQVILAYLMKSKVHPSIETIYKYLKKNDFNVSLATVYNTLQLFEQKKLVIEVAVDKTGHMRYDYFDNPHYHMICVNCGKIEDVFDDAYRQLEKTAALDTGYKVFGSQYEVLGLCPACQRKEDKISNRN